MKSPVGNTQTMKCIVEECCLTTEDFNEVCETKPFYEDRQFDTVKAAVITKNVDQGHPRKERRFFKSSTKRRVNAKELPKQEPIEEQKSLVKITEDEVIYPDCNVSNVMSIENGTIMVKRDWKKIFTVVKHVRESYLIQEFGEDQDAKDDLKYLIDGITGEHSLKVKVHSALSLVEKSMSAEFRSFIRANYSSEDFLEIFGHFHSNQKLSLCFCSLMMIMIKSRPHKEDNTTLIDQLLSLHMIQYPIPDKETLKIVETLRDCLNNVKGKNTSAVENLVLSSVDVRVETLAEMLIFILSSRDNSYLKNSEVARMLLSSVRKHMLVVMDSLEEHLFSNDEKLCRLRVRLTILNRWLQVECEERIMELFSKDVLETLLRICCTSLKTCLSGKNSICSGSEFMPPGFTQLFVEILQCLELFLLKGIKEYLSVFQCNFIEQLFRFILFLGSEKEFPQKFELMLLSLEISINLLKVDHKFIKVLTKCLTVKKFNPPYENCTSRIQCLTKLFQMNLESPIFDNSIKHKKSLNLKENKLERNFEAKEWKVVEEESTLQKSSNSCCLSLSMQNVESSMNSFLISSYIAALIGVVVSEAPESVVKVLQLIPERNFSSLYITLENFIQFMSECDVHHCHDFLLKVIEFLKL